MAGTIAAVLGGLGGCDIHRRRHLIGTNRGRSFVSQEELRIKLSAMETDALMSMWRHEDRLPWAEEVLRSELTSRGISPCILEKAAAARASGGRNPAASSVDATTGPGLLGRLLARIRRRDT